MLLYFTQQEGNQLFSLTNKIYITLQEQMHHYEAILWDHH